MKPRQATQRRDGSGWKLSKVPVMEIFGPTIQGEGMVIGQKTMFVRTAGCDYACSWCDSSFTWDGSGNSKMMEAEEIWEELKRIGGKHFSFVTISGGNPALLKNLDSFIEILKANSIKIGVETQGSKWQDWFMEIDELTISPKPPSSKMVTDFQVLDSIIAKLDQKNPAHNVSLKVVIFDDLDYEYAKEVHLRYPHIPFFLQVGNDNITTTNNQELLLHLLNKYENLIEKVIMDETLNDVKVLPQLHAFLWGNKRGV
jgi:7-carboxy-7-deazaguanine synthase